MELKDYHYWLPKELIAQYPVERGREKLLVVDRQSGTLSHRLFSDFPENLKTGDVLVLNDSRVIPARLIGRKPTGGRVEVLLVKEHAPGKWTCLLKSSKSLKEGTILSFEQGFTARIEDRKGSGYEVVFSEPEILLTAGNIPLPPYIEREPEKSDVSAYQTVYACQDGSVAAPTAGLHFSHDMLDAIRSQGVELVFITLHVGPGTFTPVRVQRIEEHEMEPEEFALSEESARTIVKALEEKRRIIAVGTTTTRVIEYLIQTNGTVIPGTGETDLFIHNGYSFRGVDALLTNFHLPCSTLLMLVSAFGGYDLIMQAYRNAIERRYRFYSYGDAMFII
ncbi:MAG TPA: tRNA preQ1(34) S-adenosylmethionine ribosyltransferase-isomerase QueA [Deltaproteobacteria bacterium]|nr:tRNA preQ1(34) S-adenosylmethionine ribosyltransferase-isomerase QueA [Deltaproteobacteria bacterium]